MPGNPQPASVCSSAHGQEVIVGVDTHKDFHVAAITTLGVLLGSKTFPTTRAGYQALVEWAHGFGSVRRAGVECTGSYGAALTRHLATVHIEVFEVNQPDKATRRRRGKNDTIDAEAAARAVLAGRAHALPKTGDGPVEMLRMFKLAKTSATKSRSQAINQLKSILVAADPQLRDQLRGLTTNKLVKHCAQLAAPPPLPPALHPHLSLLAQLIERWFAEPTTRKLRRSAHRSVVELERDIRGWISEWNRNPKPFVWTKSADKILETLAAYCQRINDSGR